MRWEGVRATAVALMLVASSQVGQASGESSKARTSAVYNLIARPQASFVWFPHSPHPGESVLLASVATDPTSPIIGYAWNLEQGAGFEAGPPAFYTTFSTFAPRIKFRSSSTRASRPCSSSPWTSTTSAGSS